MGLSTVLLKQLFDRLEAPGASNFSGSFWLEKLNTCLCFFFNKPQGCTLVLVPFQILKFCVCFIISSKDASRLEAMATRSKNATRGSWPYY